MSDKEFLTVQEVAKTLQVHTNTVRTWIKAGQLKAARLPGQRGQYRVAAADLRAFLTQADDGREKP